MATAFDHKENFGRWKPDKYKDFLTTGEVSVLVNRNRSRIQQLERAGRIPKPIRVKVGRHQVRLYSAKEVKFIQEYFKNAKNGRPRRTP